MLAALASGDPERIEFAKILQRELFWDRYGCYLHEMIEVCPRCQEEDCPIWLPLREAIAGDDDDELLRAVLENARLHLVAEIPCVTCGGATCDIFFCYAGDGSEKRG
jgi:hypothetical protein